MKAKRQYGTVRMRSGVRQGLVCGALALLLPACATAAVTASRQQAAERAAAEDASCRLLGDFYWEIGDARGTLASGSIGSSYTANTEMKIASASKFVFAAYVLEKVGQPTPEQVAALEMRSGYVGLNPLLCGWSKTMDGCFNARNNAKRDPQAVGRFFYNGGHAQYLAHELGLGKLGLPALNADLQKTLGVGIRYHSPQPAGGMKSTPAEYAAFLRRVIGGQLKLKNYLGYQPVCTQCPQALSSPIQLPWHYSLHHWIEDDPAGDGAFNSAGLLGFYPWISADKTTYGIVAREKLSRTAAQESAACGRQIRKAWMSSR